ncbi:MAG: septal ring lytic transglycosylase RlpA family protein [Candidatus Limnocylindrales bacterium]
MRRLRVVARLALIAIIATVAVPGPVGSRASSPLDAPAADLFTIVGIEASVRGPEMTTQPLDPGVRSDGVLDQGSTMFEPARHTEPPQARPDAAQPQPAAGSVSKNPWRFDRELSWYGPGFYGQGTACGQTLTRSLVGVASRSLPCGTLVTFRTNGRVVTVPVVDRGPYVSDRIFDLTVGACRLLAHCYTGSIEWRYGSER